MDLRTDVLLWVAASPTGRTWPEVLDQFGAIQCWCGGPYEAWQLLDVWEDLIGTGAVRYTDSGGTRIEVAK